MGHGKRKRQVVSAVVLAGMLLAYPGGQTAYAAQAQQLDRGRLDRNLDALEELIASSYLFDYDAAQMEEGIYAGMLAGLGDVYSQYYTAEEYAALMEELSGELCGVGIEVRQNVQTGQITLVDIYAGSPAADAGFLPGDVLTAVNGVSTEGKWIEDIVREEIKGEAGAVISLSVYRPETGAILTQSMQRAVVQVTTVKSRMLEDGLGYILVKSFDKQTAEQFAQAIVQLQGQGMTGLVIDLRDNPGGSLEAAAEMLAYLLPAGKIVYTLDRNGTGVLYQTKEGYLMCSDYPEREPSYRELIAPDTHELKLPMAVLVNGQSASAAEIFTSALRDDHRAVIVGERTFGKGIVQDIIPLNDGSAVKLTVARYFTRSGYVIQGQGITPDVVIAPGDAAETDVQLQRAMEAVKAR